MGDGIAHLDFGAVFDTGNDISYIARRKRLSRNHVEFEHTNLLRIVFFARVHELHMVASLDGAVDDFEIGDDASEGIENGVKNERLQGCVRVALRSRNALDDGFQNVFHAHTGLTAGADNLLAFAAEQLYDLVLHHVGHSRIHIAFVHHGDNLQIVLQRHVEVGDGLRLHALRSIHNQNSALACRN